MKVEFKPGQLKEIKGLLQAVSVLKSYEVITAFRRAALVLENRVKTNLSGDVLKTRSGRLRSSIGTAVHEKRGQLAAQIGSGQRTGKPVAYANMLETGGVIRPKNVQWLTVPTKFAQTAGGDGNIRAREVRNGFFRRSKNGNLILFQGGGKKMIPMFVLKKQVKIPPKRYLSLSLAQGEQDAFSKLKDGLWALVDKQ